MQLKNKFMLSYFDNFLNQFIVRSKIKYENGYSTNIDDISVDTILYYPILTDIYVKIMLSDFDKFSSQFIPKSKMEHKNAHSTCNLMLLLSCSNIHFAIVDKYAKYLKNLILYYPILSSDNTELTIKYIKIKEHLELFKVVYILEKFNKNFRNILFNENESTFIHSLLPKLLLLRIM